MRNFEYCCECDCHTGNAGVGDGSIYIEIDGKEIGPFCEECRCEIEKQLADNSDQGEK